MSHQGRLPGGSGKERSLENGGHVSGGEAEGLQEVEKSKGTKGDDLVQGGEGGGCVAHSLEKGTCQA